MPFYNTILPFYNTQRGTININPFFNDIDSKPRLLFLKYNLSLLRSILYNNGDGRYKKIWFDKSK